MKRFLLISLAVIGAFSLFTFVGIVAIVALAAGSQPTVPDAVVLELTLNEPLAEVAAEDPLQALGAKETTVHDVVTALERASKDDRVKGLVAHLGTSPGSLAVTQELRDAVKAFRASGKKAVVFAESYGEFSGGNGQYLLATAFDEIYLQPSGDVGLIGLAAETPFAKGAFEKLGVKPQMGQRHEYKNAVNTFTEDTFTEPHREATEKMLSSMHAQLVRGIAEDRKLPEDEVRALIDQGPFLAGDALGRKLVDGLAYRDEVYQKVKDGFGKDAELLYVQRYLERNPAPMFGASDTIALIYGVGNVMRGASDYNALSGDQVMGADTVSAAFRRASEDPAVKAIVFRVDSPGGSYVASDTIRREVQRAREKGKPVIVTMGNLAASGGYFVAMDADKIVAQPGTLTGSIGVYAGKFVTQELWAKLGVNWETVSTAKNAALFGTDQEFDPQQLEKVNAELDRIYEDFTTKAAAGRKLPLEKLQAVAKGRVWTGEDAKGLGLVDELGGFATAIKLAKAAAKIAPDKDVKIELFPKPKSPFEAMLAAFGGKQEGDNSESEGANARVGLGAELQSVRSAYGTAVRMGLLPRAGVLTAPVTDVKF